MTEIGTDQNMEGKRASERHLPTGEGKVQDRSGHGKSEPASTTHFLGRVKVGNDQDTESRPTGEGHSLAREGRGLN